MRRRIILFAALAVVLLSTVILSACALERKIAPTPLPTPTPTPLPRPTPTSSPTPTSVTKLSQARAELLVWRQLSLCAEQVARSSKAKVEVAFTSSYEAGRGKWRVQVWDQARGLSFGLWEVTDSTGEVTPVDEVAGAIASPNIVCDQPGAFLATGLTPPLFATPTPTPPSAPVVASGEQARVIVWLAVYSCYDPLPALNSFTAYQDSPQRWVVEGRATTTGEKAITYGLWLVDANTGDISPYDQLAQTIAANTCFRKA